MTFDQQLWWLAMLIIENASLQCPTRGIINKLGGFQTIMSFLGSIGHKMGGSGLGEILNTMYEAIATLHLFPEKQSRKLYVDL